MIQAVNMAGSSIYTLLALIAIVAQSCPLTNAKDNVHSYPRRHSGNTNINTNINTFHKSRRLYETMARSGAETHNDKPQTGKEAQTAIIATAAADAAKSATRIIARKLTETTADAVAHAVVRALSGVDETNKINDKTEQKAIKAARRASKYLNEALSRLMYRNGKNPKPASRSTSGRSKHDVIEKRQYDTPSEEEGENDGSQSAGDSDEDDGEEETETRQSKGNTRTRLHRRFLDSPDTWKNHYRRSTIAKRDVTSVNNIKPQI